MLGDNGWLIRRLRYVKTRQKEIAAAELTADESVENDSQPPNPENDLETLKTALIRNYDRVELVRLLNSTRGIRKILLTKIETDLRHRFPFFFCRSGACE